MRYFFTIAITGLAVLLSPLQANAAITLQDLGPGQTELEDDDFDFFVNAGGNITNPGADTILNVGDFFGGIIRIGQVRVPPGGIPTANANQADFGPTITALILQKISKVSLPAVNMPGVNDVFVEFTAPTLNDWTTVFAPVTAAALPATLNLPSAPDLVPGVVGSTFAIVYQDPNDIDQTAGGLLPFGPGDAGPSGLEAYELGFLGKPGELFNAAQDTDDLQTAFDIVSGSYSFNFNVTEYGIGPLLVPQDAGGGFFADVLGRNGSVGNAAPGANPLLSVSTDIDILVTPIPEPVSALVWVGLLGACGLYGGRRRR